MVDVFLNEFAEDNGITFASDIVDYAKVESMVEAGNVTWDVTNFDVFFIEQNCGELFEPLDYDVIDVSGLDEQYYGECWVAPWSYGEILAYNPDLVPEAPTSWADFFDTEKFPGQRGIYDAGGLGQEIEIGLIASGVAPDETTPLDFDTAFGQLDSIRDDLVLQAFGAEQIQQIVSGEVVMALVSTSRALDAKRSGESIDVVWETQFLGLDAYSVVKGAPNRALSMELIAEFLVPTKNIEFGRQTLFGPNVTEARDAVEQDAGLCPLMLTCPQNLTSTTVTIDNDYYGANSDEVVERWTQWKESA
jgi:putative spermidine/putrescine transport system substrate-binding protein